MASIYSLIKDFSKLSNSTEELSVSPYWIISIVRLGVPLSFSRATMSSVSTDISNGVASRSKALIITSDCINLTINNSKASYTKQLSATLKNVEFNYLIEILPGDWLMAWIVNDEDSFNDLLARINKASPSTPCNQFNDGLKFMGRVDSVRKILNQDAGGVRTSSYSVTAVGFREMDASLFYDQSLTLSNFKDRTGTWLYRIGIDVTQLLSINKNEGQLNNNSSDIIAKILDIILGNGIENSLNKTAGLGPSSSAPYAYLVPDTISHYLGISSGEITKSKAFFSYSDLLVMIRGIQQYNTASGVDTDPSIFAVSNQIVSTYQRVVTDGNLLGGAVPQAPDFCNRPVWQIMTQYLNQPINEMFTCMRVATMPSVTDGTEQQRIMPTLIVRQIPFTTQAFPDMQNVDARAGSKNPQPVKTTKFLSLPRWQIDPTLVKSANIGRSDATHVNFVHIFGQAPHSSANLAVAKQLAANKPIRDDLDIQRSGLRPYMTTVPCLSVDQYGTAPSTWMSLVADWMIGMQYTFNGTLTLIGIQSPICEGDNIEWDGVVYHIEGVSHVCNISENGTKAFFTNLALSNGMRDDGASDTTITESPIYPGLLSADNTTYDPGKTVEDEYPRYQSENYENVPPKRLDPNLVPGQSTNPIDLEKTTGNA